MSRRTEKLARLIRESVSTAVLFEVRDPRVKNVTVLDVEVAGDLRSAKVRVSVRGDEGDEKLALHGLNSARGFLQSRIGDRVELRYTPILSFEIDRSVKKSIEASRILREIEQQEGPIAGDASSAEAGSLDGGDPGDGVPPGGPAEPSNRPTDALAGDPEESAAVRRAAQGLPDGDP